ncbi:hypothetical protein FQA39_LY02122 [Lamprigera yunnana]|nr:hypothetical protein FQA39_LY02122 [Lamprigera yunnana]
MNVRSHKVTTNNVFAGKTHVLSHFPPLPTAHFTEPRIIKKAENALASDHVSKLEFDDELGCIRGDVQASMKNKFYRVEILLKTTDIEKCSCNCPRGLDICHDMVALALFAHYI